MPIKTFFPKNPKNNKEISSKEQETIYVSIGKSIDVHLYQLLTLLFESDKGFWHTMS